MVASLHFRDCTVVVLRRHGGGGGATAGAQRWLGCYCGPCAMPRRSWRCRGDPTADWPNPRWHCGRFEHVQCFRRATAKVLTVFGGTTAINDGTTAEPRRSWRCYCDLCRTSTAVAPGLRCDGGGGIGETQRSDTNHDEYDRDTIYSNNRWLVDARTLFKMWWTMYRFINGFLTTWVFLWNAKCMCFTKCVTTKCLLVCSHLHGNVS